MDEKICVIRAALKRALGKSVLISLSNGYGMEGVLIKTGTEEEKGEVFVDAHKTELTCHISDVVCLRLKAPNGS